MKIQEMFSSSAVEEISKVLNARCVEGARITRSELCQELGLTERLEENASKKDKGYNLIVETIVGSIVNFGLVPGFNSKKGLGGGFGKDGDLIPAGTKTKKIKKIEYPAGFLDQVRNTLDTLCVGEKKISRKELIKHLTLPENVDAFKALSLLSAARANGELPGFGSSVGVHGGFFRLPVVAPAPDAPDAAPAPEESTQTQG